MDDLELRTLLTDLKTSVGGLATDFKGLATSIADVKTELRAEMADMKAELRAEMAEMKAELKEHTETVETRLLSEFWKWARAAEIKSRQHADTVKNIGITSFALDERLANVEDRLSELERRR